MDNTGEALAALLRPSNAGSNTAADHLVVLDRALTQLPERWRDKPILIRADGAGYFHTLISALSAQGLEFSIGFPVTAGGDLREHADVVDITGLLDLTRWRSSCPNLRVLVRRELPHPDAKLDAFGLRDGFRYQAFTTNTGRGQIAFLEARHRAPARVEDRIRTGKDTGLGHLPSRHQRSNTVWTELALIAADLLAPTRPRYRLQHTAARSTHGQRKTFVRLAQRSTGPGSSHSPEHSL